MPNKKLLLLALAALLGFHILPGIRDGMDRRLAAPPVGQASVTPDSFDRRTTVTLLLDSKVYTYTLREYLCGLLCAELPESYPEEAWKAQAVAARSYALYKKEHTPPESHAGADLCADHTCCAAFRPAGEVLAVWGSSAQSLLDKAYAAADATDGILAVCDGEVIPAVWHSASASWTAAAAQVWGGEVAYLQEVENPAPVPENQVALPLADLRPSLEQALPGIDLSGDPAAWLQNPVYSRGGYLVSVELGGLLLRGTTVRSLLELPSAAVTWQLRGDSLVFTCSGTGHGVGMGQQGAAVLAEQGSNYGEILTYYYNDIKLLRKQ